MSAIEANQGFRLTGRHVLAALILFFLVVMGLDILFASFAYRTFSGQSANNPYEAGLQFNETLAQRKAEASLGWRATLDHDSSGAVLTFADAAGRPLEDLTVSGSLERPATEAGRLTLAFQPVGPGVYQAPLKVAAGAWDLAAEASDARGRRFQIQQRIVIR